MIMNEIENITILFHDTYEEVSKKYGYKTREDTKIFDIESPNGKTMYETVEKVVSPYLKEIERLKNNWQQLKDFVNKNCSFDDDTISYIDIIEEMEGIERR